MFEEVFKVILGLVIGLGPLILTPVIAKRKNRDWGGWLVVAFFSSWIGLIIILSLKEKTIKKMCPNPHCGADISKDKETCHRCGIGL